MCVRTYKSLLGSGCVLSVHDGTVIMHPPMHAMHTVCAHAH